MMPVLFLSHGAPSLPLDAGDTGAAWRQLGESLPRPESILMISAHWETDGTQVTAMEKPRTIHDFGGFPPELYAVEYPAPGCPELANETKSSVTKANISFDESWGLDHGCWSVLKHLYPSAEIPIVQLSLDYKKTPQSHYELAKELSALREKGVLIIGSGNIVHNLGMIAWNKTNEPEFGFDWALEANEIIKKSILSGNHKELINYKSLGKSIQLAIPTPEHFLPLLYILALQQEDESVNFFNDKAVMGSLTMTSLKII